MSPTSQLNASLIDIELAKVRALTHADQLDEAKIIIEKLYNDHPSDNIILLIYAEYLIKAQNFLQAKKILNESLKINSNNHYALKLIGQVSFLERDYENALNTLLVAEKLITPSPANEYVEIIYYIGLSYYRLEKFREAGIYLFYAQRLNHTFGDLFRITSELRVINKLFESYKRQKDDHWFLLAAFKTFRKFGHRQHQKQFLNEIKKNYPFVLEYDLIKLDLEICDLIEQNARPNQIQQLQEQAMKNNNYSGCVFAFHCESIKRRFNVN
ncbi:MAG: hypothetical protein HRT47_08100 [Candidatus Caenarcaniphilales bacterium]|nr:hypothetical protein [Candidatus Caenarcaniphilales bacterium]